MQTESMMIMFNIFFKILFTHSLETERQAEGEGETDSTLSRELDEGLDSRTPGS